MGNTPSSESICSYLRILLICRVIDGFDTLDMLERVEVNQKHRPVKEVRLERVTIHANPFAEDNISLEE